MVMKRGMLSVILHKQKIAKTIIAFLVVEMMDNFLRIKKSSKMFFHDEAVFGYMSIAVGMRMVRNIDSIVARFCQKAIPFEIAVLWSTLNALVVES